MERKLHTYLSKWYIPLCGLLLFTLALFGSDALWAAPDASPRNQTVPPPTFTPANTPVPTATPVESDDSDDDPTPTPTPFEDDPLEDPDDLDDDDTETDTGADNTDSGSDTSSGSAVDVASLPAAKVKAIVLNVRSGPGSDFPVMGTAFQDDVMRVSGQSGSWWQVCCAIGTTEFGWVDSQFVEPDFDIDDLDDLVPEIADAELPEEQSAASGAGTSASAANDSTLDFQISHDPLFIWQEYPFTMTFTVTNTSSSTLENVQIRNDFPPELIVLGVVSSDDDNDVDTADEVEFTEGVDDREVMLASWSEVASGEGRSLMVMVEVSAEVEMGAVINNLAVAIADDTDDVTAGISIGMPPTRLPNFR